MWRERLGCASKAAAGGHPPSCLLEQQIQETASALLGWFEKQVEDGSRVGVDDKPCQAHSEASTSWQESSWTGRQSGEQAEAVAGTETKEKETKGSTATRDSMR